MVPLTQSNTLFTLFAFCTTGLYSTCSQSHPCPFQGTLLISQAALIHDVVLTHTQVPHEVYVSPVLKNSLN